MWLNDVVIREYMTYMIDLVPDVDARVQIVPHITTVMRPKDWRNMSNTFATLNHSLLVIPLNIEKVHWTCVIVDKLKRVNTMYNSMRLQSYDNLLKTFHDKIFGHLKHDVVTITSPQQSDGYNCGVMVCMALDSYLHTPKTAPTMNSTYFEQLFANGVNAYRLVILKALLRDLKTVQG